MYIDLKNRRISAPVERNKSDLFAGIMLRELGGKANYMRLMKLLYLADRYHLRRYLRPIALDDYYAMHKGPTGSYWLDLLRGIAESSFFLSDKTSQVTMLREIQESEVRRLSASEIEALRFALDNFGAFDENELVSLIHEYPEWAEHKDWFEKNGGRKDIEIRNLLEDPAKDNVVFRSMGFSDPFKPLTQEEKEMVFEALVDHVVETI